MLLNIFTWESVGIDSLLERPLVLLSGGYSQFVPKG